MRSLAFVLVLAAATGLPAAAAATDRPPKVTVHTVAGAVLLGPSAASGATVTGSASDDHKVEYVTVAFCLKTMDTSSGQLRCGGLLSEARVVTADLSCRSARRLCRWDADLPDLPGEYEVVATAMDNAGQQRRSRTVDVVVVSLGAEPAAHAQG